MTTAAIDLNPEPHLLSLLDEAFSPLSLTDIAGEAASEVPWHVWRSALYGPLAGFLSRPGKEFRARMVEHGYRLAGGTKPLPEALPSVIEMLHAGSLIIDDIEDGSATRRGGPALHVEHGVPKALNAGNWLYFLPFQLASRLGLSQSTELTVQRAMSRCLLQCHYGQALDLSARMAEIEQRDVPAVVETTTRLKTGSLIELAAWLGAIVAEAGPVEARAIARFGRRVGMVLQMLDDLGSITSQKRRHKGHEDLLGGRPTWPWAWLARELSEEQFRGLQASARAVEERDLHPEELAQHLRELLGTSGHDFIRSQVDRCHRDIRAVFGDAPPLEEITRDLTLLERSYD